MHALEVIQARNEKVQREHDAVAALRKAAEKFVWKVQTGRARSRESYREFKAALALLEAENAKV